MAEDWNACIQAGNDCIKKNMDFAGSIVFFTNAINAGANDAEISEAYFRRGMSQGFVREKEKEIADYKMAADYGSKSALDMLREKGINYAPKRPAN